MRGGALQPLSGGVLQLGLRLYVARVEALDGLSDRLGRRNVWHCAALDTRRVSGSMATVWGCAAAGAVVGQQLSEGVLCQTVLRCRRR